MEALPWDLLGLEKNNFTFIFNFTILSLLLEFVLLLLTISIALLRGCQ